MGQHSSIDHTGLTGVSTLSFGSNSNSVSAINAPGASPSNSRADHVHLGVTSIAHTSNTFSGPVTLTAGANVGITVPASGSFRIDVNTASGGGGSGNYSGVLWSSGTSMPGGPATNQRITRTDLGMDFYYDGTRWLTTQLFTLELSGPFDGDATAAFNGWPFGVSGKTISRSSLWHTDFTLWFVKLYGATYVATTNSGSHYWTLAVTLEPTGTALASFNTSADSANTQTGHVTTINAAAGATDRAITVGFTKTGTPGDVYGSVPRLTYRLIGT